ncbi:MAG: DUF3990 domain-containing protein [Bacteroides sp.]|nr:DUF3990 domain-containing protein [Bacteroides sp.]
MNYKKKKIILYHGTNEKFEKPRVDKSKLLNDFGKGFYLTSNFKQAKRMAERKVTTKIAKGNIPYVYKFELNIDQAKNNLNILYLKANSKWSKFVLENRTKFVSTEADIIIGPTADGTLFDTIYRWQHDKITIEEAVGKLKPKFYSLQYCIKTNNGLRYLKYLDIINVKE